MKMKKVTALVLAGLMTFSMAACGSESTTDAPSESTADTAKTETTDATETADSSSAETTEGVTNLVLWTWNDDALSFAKWFNESHSDIQVEAINVASSGEYETKVQTAILGGEKEPDIIGGELGWLPNFMEAGFFADLDAYGAQEIGGHVVDYVWEAGQDESGVQRALGYQAAPAGFFYRKSVAEKIFGYSDPETVGKLFESYDAIMDAARVAKEKGFRLFASDSELGYCVYKEPWVVDNKVNLNQERIDMMELTSALYNEGLTAYASQWTTPWYQSMAGEVPILSEETRWGTDDLAVWGGDSEEAAEDFVAQAAALGFTDTTEVMAFGLPAWGQLVLSNHAGDTYGDWGFVAGPAYGWGGGGWFGISENSEKKDAAWEFLSWMMSDETMENFYNGFHYNEAGHAEEGVVQGNMCSNVNVIEKHKDDTNEAYGGQKLMSIYLDLAQHIDFSKQTKYDSDLGSKWGEAISSYKTGEMSKEEAINYFYDNVESTYAGELEVER
ncbi:MAG: extracellular solute-binding protein [Acetatifactor sp.]|nr:extracellular solute-binding protein [Acetatifactor sp.]